MNAILADTGPLYALADKSDQHHRQATLDIELLTERRATILVAYPTLCEAYTLVMRRLGVNYAIDWLNEIMDGTVLLNPEPADYSHAVATLQKFNDKPLTMVDALTSTLASRNNLHVWTFDSHFTLMRSRVWRSTPQH